LHITQLRIENFRNVEQAELLPAQGLNYFYGENGAGKTSILEALYLMSRGKSFRSVASEELIREGSDRFQVFLESREGNETHRLGLERSKKHWRARRDGQEVALLSEISRTLPIALMEPNSHALVSGSPEVRRRFLDWGVFHVEPQFLETWRQYARGLKQRNAALRSGQGSIVDSLDEVLAPLGERLNLYRLGYFQGLAAELGRQLDTGRQHAGLRGISMRFYPGWKEASLAESLRAGKSRDLEQCLSRHGPHRADLLLERDGRALKSLLSRGEQKNLAACLLLSQAELLRAGGVHPVILLDDLASEFDEHHFNDVLRKARACADQVWVTGVRPSPPESTAAVFHVERGVVSKVV
jgi:DNA replication and repair protein RecF